MSWQEQSTTLASLLSGRRGRQRSPCRLPSSQMLTQHLLWRTGRRLPLWQGGEGGGGREGEGKGVRCFEVEEYFLGAWFEFSNTTFFQSSPDATLRRQAGPGSLQQSACSSVQHHCSPGFRQQTAVHFVCFPEPFFFDFLHYVTQTFLASAMYTPKTKVCAKPAPRQQPSSNLRCNLGCVRREGNGTAAGCRIVKES